MQSPELTFDSPSIENTSEHESKLEQIHTFNMRDKQKSLKELASFGIEKVKSFFGKIRSYLPTNQEALSTDSTRDTLDTPDEAIIDPVSEPELEQIDYTVLKELSGVESSHMKADIYEYYEQHYKPQILKYLEKKDVSPEDYPNKSHIILSQLAEKPVSEFKLALKKQLKQQGLFDGDFVEFWKWRIAHPPASNPTLIRSPEGVVKIKYDDFATTPTIEEFLENHTSMLSEDFFEGLKTTQDIENDIDLALEELSPNLAQHQIAYDIEKATDGWVDYSMYKNVADVPTHEALQIIGTLNAELGKNSRSVLDELRNTSQSSETFGDLIEHFIAGLNNSTNTKKELRALSDIINKLNKVTVLSEQK